MYTVQQLRDLAIRYDLPKRSKLRKDDLQKAIQALKDPIITEKINKDQKNLQILIMKMNYLEIKHYSY